MQNRQCLIIEDDPSSVQLLNSYIHKLPFFSIVGICESYADAIEAINRQTYDLIFLDLELACGQEFDNNITGIDLLETMPAACPVIITTNFPQYAVESYRIGKAADYLLKPFNFNRFLLAINRALNIKLMENQIVDEKYIFLKMGRKFRRFNLEEIDYFEAYGIYLKVIVNGTPHVVNEILSRVETIIDSKHFVRTHKSYIININKITGFDHNTIFLANGKVPIGVSFKSKLQGLLNLFEN